MSSNLRRLLPAPFASEAGSSISPAAKPKRATILAACAACQKAKTKCSGDRPICHRCSTRRLPCAYDVQPNQSRASSMREVDEQLRELYTLLHTRPWNEVLEILRRIRENPDPLAVVRFIKEGDILVRGNELHECTNAGADVQGPVGKEPNPVQPRLLHTRPWTTIADDNVVQDLVSVFFEREQPFLMSFVDREMFLTDMQAKFDPFAGRPFCSTLLVNAICAITTCHSEVSAGANYASRRDLGEAFFTESKRLLELQCGKPSIPTAQALFIMFSYSCRMGQDRAGHIFRAAGYEMLRRMMPKVKRAVTNTTRPYNSRRALSRAIWGMFCYDSICSSAYLCPSLLPVPDLPRPSSSIFSADLHGDEAKLSNWSPSSDEEAEMVFSHACDLSEIFNRVLHYAGGYIDPGGNGDGKLRLAQLYADLVARQSSLPLEEGYLGRHCREHSYLWAYYHLVAIHITRLLQTLDGQLPGQVDRPRDICIRHCQDIMKHVDQHLTRYPTERQGCLAVLYFAYSCTITLIDLIGTSMPIPRPFSQACLVFFDATVVYPLSSLLLEGLAVVAKHMGVELPADTTPYFTNVPNSRPRREAITLGFVVPVRARLAALLAADEWEYMPEETGIELGDLLARFESVAVE